ncbi:MAG: 3-hydroxybutyryl-CoA dehydrogenase [Gemmatimonadetes bacterium]|nr:3-hydroxybutyryl-CoA dehydrogenase [Gemmatimonadota bacterium]
MSIERVGVVGCGLMGSGIAEVAARAGRDVTVREPSAELLRAGRDRIERSMERAVSKEKLSTAERDRALERLRFTTDLSDLAACDLVIEAIVEDVAAKRSLFQDLDALCGARTIFASNTSSLPISAIAAATSRPDRFVGLHFFNPVPVMALVEVVRTLLTGHEAFESAVAFVRALGKVPISAKDASGFVVNLLLVPYMLDAIRQLERGVASISDIDTGMVLGCGHPMGPFTLCDFVGLDTLHRISEIMYEEYREERYAPPPLLRRLVTLGRFGKKNGRGFYDWGGPEPVPLAV